MKVAELIERLKEMPQESDVYFSYWNDYINGESWDEVATVRKAEGGKAVLLKEE